MGAAVVPSAGQMLGDLQPAGAARGDEGGGHGGAVADAAGRALVVFALPDMDADNHYALRFPRPA
jgi:hypothetical protein